jgi:hypothetical protein
MSPPAPTSDASSAVGRPARTTSGLAIVGIYGTRLIREECAQLACTNGLKPSASRAVGGRRIRIGTQGRIGAIPCCQLGGRP